MKRRSRGGKTCPARRRRRDIYQMLTQYFIGVTFWQRGT